MTDTDAPDPGVLTVGATYESRGPDPRRMTVLGWDSTLGLYKIEHDNARVFPSDHIHPTAARMWRQVTDA